METKPKRSTVYIDPDIYTALRLGTSRILYKEILSVPEAQQDPVTMALPPEITSRQPTTRSTSGTTSLI